MQSFILSLSNPVKQKLFFVVSKFNAQTMFRFENVPYELAKRRDKEIPTPNGCVLQARARSVNNRQI